jgi:hypothetical protein
VVAPLWPAEYRWLLAFFADTPPLPGALCRGHSDIFDAPHSPVTDDDRERIRFAMHACRVCPALLACARWDEAQPRRQHATGVVAGKLHRGPDVGWKPGAAG